MAFRFTPEEFNRSRHHRLLRIINHDSRAWLAQSATGAYRVIQVVERWDFVRRSRYDREYNEVQDFAPISRAHENLLHILGLARNDEPEYFYYVLELADDQTTGQQIDPGSYQPQTLRDMPASHARPDFAECLNVCLALASAVQHLHEHGLIHGDIKLSTVLLVNAKPKLSGIGVPRASHSFPSGTPGYIAPEGNPTPQADIYSLGKCIYELATGQDLKAFPTLPENWGQDGGEAGARRQLNEIILKACEHVPRERYQSVEELRNDLLRLG